MATYKALVNFGGVVSMHVGEVKTIADVNIAKDLLKAGYIAEVKPAEKAKQQAKGTTEKATEKKERAKE